MIDTKARQVLRCMADHYERDPEAHLRNGVSERTLGAETGAYLGFVYHEVEQLVRAGYISRLDPIDITSKIIITKAGYRSVRPPQARILHWISTHKIASIIGTIVTMVGIVVGILGLLKTS